MEAEAEAEAEVLWLVRSYRFSSLSRCTRRAVAFGKVHVKMSSVISSRLSTSGLAGECGSVRACVRAAVSHVRPCVRVAVYVCGSMCVRVSGAVVRWCSVSVRVFFGGGHREEGGKYQSARCSVSYAALRSSPLGDVAM